MREEWTALKQAMERCAPGDWRLFGPLTAYFRGFATRDSCGQCVPCREGSKRILELLERVENGERSEQILDWIEPLADTVIATALCGHGREACREVLRALVRFRGLDAAGYSHPGLTADAAKEHPFIHADDCRGCGKWCGYSCAAACAPQGARDQSPAWLHIPCPGQSPSDSPGPCRRAGTRR